MPECQDCPAWVTQPRFRTILRDVPGEFSGSAFLLSLSTHRIASYTNFQVCDAHLEICLQRHRGTLGEHSPVCRRALILALPSTFRPQDRQRPSPCMGAVSNNKNILYVEKNHWHVI